MNSKSINIHSLLIALLLILTAGCSTEQISSIENEKSHKCKLKLDVSMCEFDSNGTRSNSYEWSDNSTVYIVFMNGENRVTGRAVYGKSEDLWTLYYDGILPNGSGMRCNAYYFDNMEYKDASGLKILQSNVPVYSDDKGSYTKDSEGIRVKISLIPLSGRIKFKGEIGKEIRINGLKTFKDYDPSTGIVANEMPTIGLRVGSDGFTEYIYSNFPSDSRSIALAYDNYVFTTDCDAEVLKTGESGYMEIPTQDQHNGWNLKEISLPTLENVTVSDIGKSKATLSSRLVNSGNGTIWDCGFCYSTSPSVTIDDKKVSCGVSEINFGKTIYDLSENTTYYVKAYAINEVGVGYGEELSFKTLEVTTPTVSEITLGVVSNTYVEVSANVTSIGNGTLQDTGFVYSKEAYPTLESEKISCGKLENLNATISNLLPETTYHVRAYATNEKGTSYGEEKTVKTPKTEVNPYTVIEIETQYGYYKLNLATVTGGTFKMGAQTKNASESNYDTDAYADEDPVHNVTLSTFLIGNTTVTQKLWYVVMGSYPNLTSANGLGDEYPVYNVTFTQCKQFISKLNNLTGKKFRLPTEAEWEYAARGGTNDSGYKYSGSTVIGKVAWYNANSSGKLHEVEKKEANELSIYDMSGNIWEWTSDWYGNYSYKDQTSPTGASSGSLRVIRGGCYSDSAKDCRVTVRSNAAESTTLPTLGFRLVMD